MTQKTTVTAEEGKPEIRISREFELPVELLFKAHAEPDLVEQWMGTKVLKMESKKHGGWEFETSDPNGNVVFKANGVFHEFIPNQKITRTFEMNFASFDVQLEFIEFEPITDDTSRLRIHSIYRSVELRDQVLEMPFEYGINMAHDMLQDVMNNLK